MGPMPKETFPGEPVRDLPESACWNLLAGQEVGRLSTALNQEAEIFPINFVLDGEAIVFRSAEGTKLFQLAVNSHVAFEVDGWTEESGWSVVAKGRAELIEDPAQLARLAKLPLRPWVPTRKQHWVRVAVDSVTGRHFDFGPEPADDTVG